MDNFTGEIQKSNGDQGSSHTICYILTDDQDIVMNAYKQESVEILPNDGGDTIEYSTEGISESIVSLPVGMTSMVQSGHPVQLEDGTTAFMQTVDEKEATDVMEPKFIEGQPMQLDDGSTAFLHTSPKYGVQSIQLGDGTTAHLARSFILENYSDIQKDGCDDQKKFKVHEHSPTSDRPFRCGEVGCNKAFATWYNLKSHTQIHATKKPFQCVDKFCNKTFKSFGALENHFRTHTGQRPFKCPYEGCDKSFRTSNIVKVHMRTHTGEPMAISAKELLWSCSKELWDNSSKEDCGQSLPSSNKCSNSPEGTAKQKKSPVWEYFDTTPVNGKFRCLNCNTDVAAPGSNTSNLAKHMRRHHSVVVLGRNMKRPYDVKGRELLKPSLNPAEDKIDRYNRAIGKYIALSCKAYDIVEYPAFIDLLQTFEPKFKPKPRQYFSREAIPDLVKTTRCKIEALLEGVEYCAGTCDTWTNPIMEPFFAFTVYFIHDFELKSACLGCALFEKDHTSGEMALWILDLMAAWELKGKLVAITTDNGSKICAAVDIIRESQKLLHMRCFRHSAYLAAERCYELKEVEVVLQKARKMRQLLTTSTEFKKILEKERAALKLNDVLLNTDGKTWWSSLKLLNGCIAQRDAFSEALEHLKKKEFQSWKMSEKEAKNVKGIVEILEILKETVDTLSDDKCCTASIQIPLMNNLKRLSRDIGRRYHEEITSLGDEKVDPLNSVECRTEIAKLVDHCCDLIDEELDQKYPDADKLILEKCSFYDPRFKFLTPSRESDLKEKLLKDISEISSASSTDSLSDVPEPPKKGRLSLLFRANKNSACGEGSIEEEYNRYVNTVNLDLDEDPLIWWKENSLAFPRISKAMLRFLCIQVTSTSLERVFCSASTGDDNNQRSVLCKDGGELIFLSMNKDFV